MVNDPAPHSTHTGLRLAVLALAIALVGLPINSAADYALLVVAAIVIFTGAVRVAGKAWLAAVLVAIGGQWLLAPPRIDEGHNVFLPSGPDSALARGLPADVYRQLSEDFEQQYPAAQRCSPDAAGCWVSGGYPDRPFAFSADGIFHESDMSRAVTEIDFSDPVWLRLGFINDMRYNWYPVSDVQRASRDRHIWAGLHRWQLSMPWFEMIRVPAAYVGSQLCWRGDIMWEGAAERFSLLRGDGCRAIEPPDAGHRVVGIGIKPASLAMRLEPPMTMRIKQIAQTALRIASLLALLIVLVRFRPRQLILPALLVGLAALVIAIDDASFLGGVRPLDGGDDGLFYDGVGRAMLQKLLAGDVLGFLVGGEPVFYYGGPGLRYFRALEHIVFGDSFLGYLSLVLLLPLLFYGICRRFMPAPWPLALSIIFVAIPLGALFGTTFIDYSKWASRGFADPAAYILFVAGLLLIVGRNASGPNGNFTPPFFGALLLAAGIAMKPIIAPAAAVFLGGAGLWALYCMEWRRLAGMCLGFLPVLSMAWHNWYFGRVFVLFSSNASHPLVYLMPPAAWISAGRELMTLDFSGEYLTRAGVQIANWLAGPSQLQWTGPVHAVGVGALIYIAVRGRQFDPWLRLISAAALAQHCVALFYITTARYHFLTWFLTVVADAAFFQHVGLPWLRERYPRITEKFTAYLWPRWLAVGIDRLQRSSL